MYSYIVGVGCHSFSGLRFATGTTSIRLCRMHVVRRCRMRCKTYEVPSIVSLSRCLSRRRHFSMRGYVSRATSQAARGASGQLQGTMPETKNIFSICEEGYARGACEILLSLPNFAVHATSYDVPHFAFSSNVHVLVVSTGPTGLSFRQECGGAKNFSGG